MKQLHSEKIDLADGEYATEPGGLEHEKLPNSGKRGLPYGKSYTEPGGLKHKKQLNTRK